MIQFLTYHHILLVDKDDDLFIPFHLLMCTAIASILEFHDSQENPFMMHNRSLLIWKCCTFTGSESWKVVQCALQNNVSVMYQYIHFVMLIQGMKSFIKVLGHQERDRFMLSTLMSLDCFIKYNLDNFCHYDVDVDICGFTAHSLAMGCDRCEDNYNLLVSDKHHVYNCSYYLKIQPYSHYVQVVRDEKETKKELLQGAVIKIYQTIIRQAEEGNGCMVLPPPPMKYCSQ
jgi:hypothetical protein